jgi:glycerol-3-phosphate O-acyltransferase
MKFSSSILSAALLYSASTAAAFSTQQLRTLSPLMRSATTSTILASTTEKEAQAETTATTTSATISPEFEGGRDQAIATLKSQLSPEQLAVLEQPLTHFISEYFQSLSDASAAGVTNPDGTPVTPQQAVKNMLTTLSYGLKYGLGKEKFIFEDVRHRALRGADFNDTTVDARYENEKLKEQLGPDVATDFYAAGCDFFRPSIDLDKSVLLGKDNLEKAREQLANGENVVFLANHQSEADPQVVSCLFETVGKDMGDLAAHVTYVAGHKVTTDALAVPFSMGRNLLCIHSKKHIDADPETKPAKSKQNMAAMSSMLGGLKEGGMAIWVAPSGGRDRRNVDSGKIPIAPFDQKTVDMFRLMGNKSKKPTHFYPFAMVSYDLCPPPDFVEAGVGEKRNVRFTPVGIAVCDEVPNVGGAEKRHLFTEKAEEECIKGYTDLLKGLDMEKYIPEEYSS